MKLRKHIRKILSEIQWKYKLPENLKITHWSTSICYYFQYSDKPGKNILYCVKFDNDSIKKVDTNKLDANFIDKIAKSTNNIYEFSFVNMSDPSNAYGDKPVGLKTPISPLSSIFSCILNFVQTNNPDILFYSTNNIKKENIYSDFYNNQFSDKFERFKFTHMNDIFVFWINKRVLKEYTNEKS